MSDRLHLFAITPGRGDAAELLGRLPLLSRAGVRRLLLREKGMDGSGREELAVRVARECQKRGLELWVSEDAALAVRIRAFGVHLSERSPSPRDLPAAWRAQLRVGVSLHEPLSRSPAELECCHHAFLGPVFPTPSKPGNRGLGLERFRELAAGIPCECYALGGVDADRLLELARANLCRAAAVRLFFGKSDPAVALRRVRQLLAQVGGEEGLTP